MTETRRFGWLWRFFASSPEKATEDTGLACRELVELVTNYLDGALPAPERARFETHIAMCPHCSEYLSQIRQTISAAGRLREEHLAPEAREALLGAFRNWKAG